MEQGHGHRFGPRDDRGDRWTRAPGAAGARRHPPLARRSLPVLRRHARGRGRILDVHHRRPPTSEGDPARRRAADQELPVGHTAAAIALYVGLAIILTPHVRHAAFRALIWLFAVLIPVFVGISRVYRGMHHATDVFGSVILGTLALGFAWLIVACVASVWRDRQLAFPEAGVAEIDRTPAEATS